MKENSKKMVSGHQICASCGGASPADNSNCDYCGNPLPPLKGTGSLSAATQSQPDSGLACLRCHKDDRVEKVSAIVANGTQKISGSVPVTNTYHDADGVFHSDRGYEDFSGTQISNLAQLLTPPAKPTRGCLSYFALALALIYPPFFVGLYAYGLIAGILVALGADKDASYVGTIGFLFAILAAGLTIWGVIFVWNKYGRGVKQARLEWDAAMQKWEHLYYCHRDGHIFIPGETDYTVAQNIRNFIYQK